MNKLDNCLTLPEEKLSSVNGGGKEAANMFLSGTVGAVQGLAFCAQTIPFPNPYVYVACAAGGATAAIIWPQ